jgi:hypothetical protein
LSSWNLKHLIIQQLFVRLVTSMTLCFQAVQMCHYTWINWKVTSSRWLIHKTVGCWLVIRYTVTLTVQCCCAFTDFLLTLPFNISTLVCCGYITTGS